MALIHELGLVAFPLLLVLLLTLAQIVRCTVEVRSRDRSGSHPRIHSILVLGVLGSSVGLLGSLIGVQEVATAVALHPEPVGGDVVLEGIGITLGSSVFGLAILGIAAVAWLALQWASGRKSRLEPHLHAERDIP